MPIYTLPEGYTIRLGNEDDEVRALSALAGAGRFGANFTPPSHHKVYGGSSVFTAEIAEEHGGETIPVRWFVATGDKPGGGFGPYAFKVVRGNPVPVPLSGELIDHVGCWVVVNWLKGTAEIVQFRSEREIVVVPLPGFYAGKVEAPTVVVQPGANQPAPVAPTDCIDEDARKYTTSVKDELYAEIAEERDRLAGQIATLESRIRSLESTGGSVDLDAVKAWLPHWLFGPGREKVASLIYLDMQRPESGIVQEIVKLIRRESGSGQGDSLTRDEAIEAVALEFSRVLAEVAEGN